MIDREIRYTNLTKIEHRLYCDKCGNEMHLEWYTSDIITRYTYKCRRCNEFKQLTVCYPYTEIVGEECYRHDTQIESD